MGAVPFPAIDYTDRDYASLRQSMLNGATARLPEWTSRSPQDFGVVLIELFATVGDILSYYIDRAANEMFLPTATQRSSVLKLAAMLNYRARGTAASSADVYFTVDAAMNDVIPAGTVLRSRSFNGSVPVLFTTITDLVVTPSDETHVVGPVRAVQGTVRAQEEVGTSSGNQDESFVLPGSPVVEASLIVQVREDPENPDNMPVWSFTESLLDARPGDNAYATVVDANGVLTLQFGDGVNGRVPPRDSVVFVTYRVGGGSVGNVGADAIVEMVDPIEGVLSLANPDAATGGSDAESIESIRYNAPRSLLALNRAVTLEDFAALALQVPQVAKARAEAAVYTNVTVYVAPFGGGQPPQRLLNDVVGYLADRKLVGVDVVAASPTYVPIDVSVTLTIDAAYNTASVRAGVERALRVALGFDSVDFGQRVSISDLYATITGVAGVAYASLRRLNRRGQSGVVDVDLSPNEIPVAGSLVVSGTGGVSGADPTGTGGTLNEMPSPPSAPTVVLSRCDSGTMHLEVAWSAGANTTVWYLEIQYLDVLGEILNSFVMGPAYSPNQFIVDPVSNDDAASVGLRLQAYNGDTGPVYGPIIYVPNPCGS